MLDVEVLAELMHRFLRHPALIPPDPLEKALASAAENLNRVAIETLLELDSGRLVAARGSIEFIDEVLRETSANTGVLFFADKLYSPTIPGFVRYSTPKPLAPLRLLPRNLTPPPAG